MASAVPAAAPGDLLAVVRRAQEQLTELEATAKGLIDELAGSGAAATPRLRELLATGARLVASVQQAGEQLGPLLPAAGAPLPAAPDRAAVEAVWARQQAAEGQPALLPTPVAQPAASLAALAASLGALPGVSLQLLKGRQPAAAAEQATAVLLRCGRAFAAVVHLQPPGGLAPLRVAVLSAAEADAALRGSAGGSLWAPSRHAVCQHLSAQAALALQHFKTAAAAGRPEAAGASALELLLLWLATCSDVFSRPPAAGGPLLLADPAAAGQGLLPPLHRPWGLGWQELWQAALNPQLRQAQHLP